MATVPKLIITSDEELIRTLAKEWEQHQHARNIDKLLTLYTADGMIMAPFYPLSKGATAMRQYFVEEFTQLDPRNLTIETTHVEITGNTAFSVGTFTVNLKMPNDKRMDVPGKWTTVLRRVGSNWKIFAHCWNSDLPVSTFTT
jgi:ketosteroid isomerase-like protein